MSSSPSDVFSEHDIFSLITNCLKDRDFINFGRLTRSTYARLIESTRYKDMKRSWEVVTRYPDQNFLVLFQRLRKQYSQGIATGFLGPLKRYSQSDAMKEMAKSALACFDSVHEVANRCTRMRADRVVARRNIQSLLPQLAKVLPHSGFKFSECDEQLKTMERLPHTQTLVSALHAVFVNEALLSLAEKAIFKNLSGEPQSSIFCDIYALLDSLEKYYGFLNYPAKPIESFYEKSYGQYHGKVKAAVQKLQQVDSVSHALVDPRYILPFAGMLIGLLIYMYHHPTRGRGISYPGVMICLCAMLVPAIRMAMSLYKAKNEDTLRELAAIPLSEIRKTEEESSEEETESPRP